MRRENVREWLTNCDLSGCTQPDRSSVGLSRFAGERALRIQLMSNVARESFSGPGMAAATGLHVAESAPGVP